MEIVVALGILSVVLVALGGLMYQVSYQTRRSTALSFLAGAAQSAQARVEGLAWDSLAGAIGCVADSMGQLHYTRCMTVTVVTPKLTRVQVVLQPTGNLLAPPETLTVDRTRPQLPSTLNVK